MMYQGPGFGMFGMHLFLVLGFLAVVAVVIAVIVLAVHASTRTAYPTGAPPMQMGVALPPARETPLEILARRFASGEITADEYQRARDLLEGGRKT
jgi:uncharacterized membrane protein